MALLLLLPECLLGVGGAVRVSVHVSVVLWYSSDIPPLLYSWALSRRPHVWCTIFDGIIAVICNEWCGLYAQDAR